MAKKTNPDEEKFILMDMPEVKDIPGQENVRPPRMREMEDVTISSADEEGEGILDDLNSDEANENDDNSSDLGYEEKRMLNQTDRSNTEEAEDIEKMKVDQTDGEDVLNETSDPLDFGADLDIPGSELDDSDEDLGEEDEENNEYSQPD